MSEPTVMQSSYDPTLMASWSTLMTEARTAIVAAGAYPTPSFFPYATYHGDATGAVTKDLITDLMGVDLNSDMDAAWDSAFHSSPTPSMLAKEDELYSDFRQQNTAAGAGPSADAFLADRLDQINNQIAPAIYLKFLANNCVFSSLYAQAIIDMERSAGLEAAKLEADLVVNLTDKAANRTTDLLKLITQTESVFMVSRSEIAIRKMQLYKTFQIQRAQYVLNSNQIMQADRLAMIRAQLAANLDEKRFGLENLKYVISAQGAMQGIHTLQSSTSGPAAMGDFGSAMSYLSGGFSAASAGIGLFKDISALMK